MKKRTSIIVVALIVITLAAFKKEPPKDHEFVIKGNLSTFKLVLDHIDKSQEILKRTSSLPSSVLTPELDTLSMITNFFAVQIQAQISEFQKEDKKQDSIDNAKNKK